MLDRAYIALRATAAAAEPLWLPLAFLVALCGLVGTFDTWILPQCLDILPIENWPLAARIAFGVIH